MQKRCVQTLFANSNLIKKANNDMEDQIKTSKTKNVNNRIKIEIKSESDKIQ